jgi:DNA mismatch repair protein MutS2
MRARGAYSIDPRRPTEAAHSVPQSTAFPTETLECLELEKILQLLADRASSPAGARMLREAHPRMDAVLRTGRRARGIEGLAAARREHQPGISGMGDLDRILALATKRILEGEELVAVADALDLVRMLALWVAQHPEYTALRDCLAGAPLEAELREQLRGSLGRRGEVMDDAHPELGKARQKVRKILDQRARKMEEIAEGLQKSGVLRQRLPVQRGDRLLLAVRATDSGRARGVVHDRSQSGDTLFIEPGPVLELSNRLAETRALERRIIQEVLTRLTKSVLQAESALRDAERRLGEADVAFTTGRWAEEEDGEYPEMHGPVLELRQARHPLLQAQMEREDLVPLSLELGRDFELLVVTGPNTGGKTVVLKTVGVCAAMAMCGLPILADHGSRVPELPGLHADIGDAQSLESSLSTFSGHLSRTLQILRAMRPGSLILLDELGTGTDPEEGAAIGQAVLEHLLKSGALTIANTHLGQLKMFSTGVQRAENASMEFDPENLAPRFRLLVGVPGASHAVEVAERLGLPEPLLARARELSAREGGAERLIADVGRVRRDAELMRERARDLESESRATQERIAEDEEVAKYRLELREAEAEEAFLEHARRIEHLRREQLDPIAARLRGAEQTALKAFFTSLDEELANCELGERWLAFVTGLKKGDVVYVPRFRDRLHVLKVSRAKQTAKLRHGNLEVDLAWRDLTWVEPPPGGP